MISHHHPYDPMSIVQFQTSVLSLAAALDRDAPVGSEQVSGEALVEAQQLRDFLERSR